MTLEELLNNLIQMGWKPRNIDGIKKIRESEFLGYFSLIQEDWREKLLKYSLRDLVSIESGFRQFVVEKGLAKAKGYVEICNGDEEFEEDNYWSMNHKEEGYRLMLSSIQTDLEKFILDNILIPNE